MNNLSKALKLGPDMYSKGHTVYIEGKAIGEFDDPIKAIIAIERALRGWTDSLLISSSPE